MSVSKNEKDKKPLDDNKICIVIPTFNNEKTIASIIKRTLRFTYQIIIIDDGCTDHTHEQLSPYLDKITIIKNKRNRGKGYALKIGLTKAQTMGYRYAITLDADGQHYPEDIPLFIEEIKKYPDALIIGSRTLQNKNMSKNSTFANRLSNFWFYIQTGKRLPDTQTGFRLYPLQKIKYLKLLTTKYEAELELLVFSAWHDITIQPISIHVYYPPKSERVSHFRPFTDFARISILNTLLCIATVIYGVPLRAKHFIRRIIQ